MTYAIDIYAGNGAETEFDLTFEFISRDHVVVTVINNADGFKTPLRPIETGLPVGNEYRWENDTRIKVGTAPASDQKIQIERNTPENQQLVPWSDGSYFIAEDLNTSDLQWLYGLQELEDKFGSLENAALKYYGAVDLTVDQPPSTPRPGDFYINTGAGNVIAGWTGIAGDAISGSEQVVYNGTIDEWQIFETPAGQAGVVLVTSTSPIEVDAADPQRPGVSITAATGAAAGSMSAADKTKLDGIADGAEANVNADWNAATGDAEILNKPAIPAAQVNSDWDATSGKEEILNKPAIIPEAPNDGQQYARQSEAWSVVTGGGGGGGVTQIVAGSNVTISPTNGTGVVTVNSTGGGGSSGVSSITAGAGIAVNQSTGDVTITNTGGGGGGGDVINYSGAAAWGKFDANGNLEGGLNCSITKEASSSYDVTFTTPMPDANYSITIGATELGRQAQYSQATANGFRITTASTVTGSPVDISSVSFAVHALSALPPRGGTGADCWGSCQSDGTIDASFNVASVTKTGTGQYDVVFTTPMPTATYSVTTTVAQRTYGVVSAINKTTAGFAINTVYNSGGSVVSSDYAFNFTVNATNATLPQTVTQEQIDAAINNPGLSAWGEILDGVLVAGNNIASITDDPVNGAGVKNVVFTTPMPSANYSVTGSAASRWVGVLPNTQTATGFALACNEGSGAASPPAAGFPWSFQVAATNALPPKGGTGVDAWAACKAGGAIEGSFNIASVTKRSTGIYDVVFTTPMPTNNYSVVGSIGWSVTSGGGFAVLGDKTVNGFAAQLVSTANAYYDYDFNFTVNATNATLPATLTQDMLVMKAGDTMTGDLTVPNITVPGTGVIDAIQTPKAMVQFAVTGSGAVTINANYNVAAVTFVGNAGRFKIDFINAIPGTAIISASSSTGLVTSGSATFVYTISGSATGWNIGTLASTATGTLTPESSLYYFLVWYGL